MENNTVPVENAPVEELEKKTEIPVVVPKKTGGISKIVITLLVLLVVALGVAAYYFYSQTKNVPLGNNVEVQPMETVLSPKVPPVDISDWLIYTNKEAGFSFKYPESVKIVENEIQNDTNVKGQLLMYVAVVKLSDIPEDLPMRMGRVDALEQKAELINGGENTIKIGSLYGQTAYGYAQFEVCSVFFSRSITFYPGEYRVRLDLSGPVDKIQADMPSFFKVDQANCGDDLVWNLDLIDSFESTLKNQKGAGMGQEWHNTFYNILDTLELVTSAAVSGTTYTNEKYGFELTYDAPYKVLVDKDNLYGYPNGVILIYKGGQAYDIVVEAWDTKAAYEKQYSSQMAKVTVLENKGKFITFFDNTESDGNNKIIESAKTL